MTTNCAQRLLPAIAGTLCFITAGCGGIKHVPVSGNVTLDGAPLQGGALAFTPDESKGNTHRCGGYATAEGGRYEANSIGVRPAETGSGLIPGWYKVTLNVHALGQPKIKVNPIFTDDKKTPLSIEVVENPEPGAYDLKLTK